VLDPQGLSRRVVERRGSVFLLVNPAGEAGEVAGRAAPARPLGDAVSIVCEDEPRESEARNRAAVRFGAEPFHLFGEAAAVAAGGPVAEKPREVSPSFDSAVEHVSDLDRVGFRAGP